jgi:putative DNA primase/helicase
MTPRIDFSKVNAVAMPQLLGLVVQMLPHGKLEGDEWVSLNPTRSDQKRGSFKVNVKTGMWSDFATGDSGGDVISLRAYILNVSQIEAARQLALMLGLQSYSAKAAKAAQREAAAPHPKKDKAPEDTPIFPVPADAPAASLRHYRHGDPAGSWAYLDAGGKLLGYIARFDIGPKEKEVLPYTFCSLANGGTGWRWKSFPIPRPLYGLKALAERPDAPVLVVEGEKTADAAAALLPDYVIVTWPGGSKAVKKADWAPLKGRKITIWPDNDEPGLVAAADIVDVTKSNGAASAGVVEIPDGLDDGWDLADDIPAGLDITAVLETAAPPKASLKLPSGFHFGPQGLMWSDPTDDEKAPMWVAGPLDVLAETRDADGQSWGVLLRWFDNDGREHRLPLSRATLAGDGADARRILIDGGYAISEWPGARAKFSSFLLRVQSPNRARAVLQTGWHGEVFVLPDACFGAAAGDHYLLQSLTAHEHAFRQSGSLEDWHQNVARLAVGNSRLTLAICAAFAGPLLNLVSAESGGFHLRGASSTGKTTALLVGGSVWGGGQNGYIRTWRATANGLEGVAASHSDCFLVLDELSQISSKEAGEAAYMLGNNTGKQRSGKDGTARRAARFRTLFLSSGEISLADKVAEDGRGKRLAAGQQVRIIDIPADAGAGLGLFENLHEFETPESLARHLRSTTGKFYGVAAREFLTALAGDLHTIGKAVSTVMQEFVEHHVPASADGQVERVAQRFALVAAGGEIAALAGVVPWPAGAATAAAARCFKDWLAGRGGIESAEASDALAQIRSILLACTSRFIAAWDDKSDSSRLTVRDILGYRKEKPDGSWDYFCTAPAWKNELCAGFDAKRAAASLVAKGFIEQESDHRRAKLISVPGFGKTRLYHILSHITEDSRDA